MPCPLGPVADALTWRPVQYSGEYNLLAFTVALIWFDHFLETKMLKDLQRLVTTSQTLYSVRRDVELSAQQEKVLTGKQL